MLNQSNASHFTMVPLADLSGTSANKNITLSDNLSKYDFLGVAIHRGNNTVEFRTLPIFLFTRNTTDVWEFYASTSGTTRDVYLKYVNDNTIYYNGTSVAGNARLEFFGMLGGGLKHLLHGRCKMLNSSMNPELQGLLNRISSLESRCTTLEDRDYIVQQTNNAILWNKGKMICFGYVSVGSAQNISGSYSSYLPKGISFVETPIVTPVWANTSTNDTKEWNIRSYNAQDFTIHKNSSHSNAQGVMFIAIGRWK